MTTQLRIPVIALASVLSLGALVGCDLDVINPSVIDAASFDPEGDAPTLSMSAQTDLYNAFGSAVIRGAYFSGEAWVGAVRQETNDFGRRVITSANLDINPSLWAPISLAVATNEEVIGILSGGGDAGSNINLARSSMNSAFALLLMAEHFCEGVILVSPIMSVDEVLDRAIERFEQAFTVAQGAGGSEGSKIMNAAKVGAARAYLQKGDLANAIQSAANIPSDFVYEAVRVDDPANRGRAGNPVYGSTDGRTFIVPEAYRALNDPRVPYQVLSGKAQDGQLDLVVQTKYPGYGANLRIASGLEARYIDAEARLKQGNSGPALALIEERRAENGQESFGQGSDSEALAELMNQRARDFWLEGKAMGDYRRNPDAAPFVPPAGTEFYKPGQGTFGTLTCIPVPNEEKDANPNIG